MRESQSVSEMAGGVLTRHATTPADRTGQAFESVLEAVARTEAGRHLTKLETGEHRSEGALDWQASVARRRAEERHYSWVEGYMEWLQGKEARADYHAFLEKEFASFKD